MSQTGEFTSLRRDALEIILQRLGIMSELRPSLTFPYEAPLIETGYDDRSDT